MLLQLLETAGVHTLSCHQGGPDAMCCPGAGRKLRPALAEVCIGPGSVGSWPESCGQLVVKSEPGSWLLDPRAQHQ